MADARTYYIDPSVVINQINMEESVNMPSTVENTQTNINNQLGGQVVNIGVPIPDVFGNVPFLMDGSVNPAWNPTYSDATFNGDIVNQNNESVLDSGGAPINDADGNMPFIMGPNGTVIINPMWTPTYSNARFAGDIVTSIENGMNVLTVDVDNAENSVFVGASNRLNILNNTANGVAPLDALGRQNYNVVTVTDDAYEALEDAGTVDANTLYLIRETV